jgi:hypothetical protein
MEDLQTQLTLEQKERIVKHICETAVLKDYLHQLEDLSETESELEGEVYLAVNAAHSVGVHLTALLVR